MHRFMTPLDDFMRGVGQQFEIDRRSERSLTMYGNRCRAHRR
jgi:hypothetical protein